MENAQEFSDRYFNSSMGAAPAGQLARMVAARDAERDAAIRKEYESNPPMLVENERQKRIDERANAIINGRAMHYGYCSDEWWAAAYESAIMGEVWRQRFIEAERERRLKK